MNDLIVNLANLSSQGIVLFFFLRLALFYYINKDEVKVIVNLRLNTPFRIFRPIRNNELKDKTKIKLVKVSNLCLWLFYLSVIVFCISASYGRQQNLL